LVCEVPLYSTEGLDEKKGRFAVNTGKICKGIVAAALVGLAGGVMPTAAAPLDSGFTYQGSLEINGSAMTGTVDFQFSLWDAGSGGTQIGTTVTYNAVAVDGGLFAVNLDFGFEVFNGDARWLEVSVRNPAGSGSFVTLRRQPLNPSPYSLQTRGIFVDNQLNVGIGTTNPGGRLAVEQDGGGHLLYIRQTNTGIPFAAANFQHWGSGPTILSSNVGTGHAGDFRSTGSAGAAVRGLNQGSGSAGLFEINSLTNSSPALDVSTNGTGPAAIFDGDVEIGVGSAAGRLVVDGPGSAPAIMATSPWYAIRGSHNTTTGTFPGLWGDTDSLSSGATGVRGYINSTSPGGGASGVRGINNGTNGNGYGVYGSHAGGGYGVFGSSVSGRGVYGAASGTTGVNQGVYGLSPSTNGYGVFGSATATSGSNFGVYGTTNSDNTSSAGVYGYSDSSMGVQGASVSFRGVYGTSISGNGVYGRSSSGNAVFADGNFGASGTKSFIQPDPTDASREIRFVCLEGNESGTYFRGTAKLEDGRAYIEVPEEFRLVTESEDLTVQVTARGPDAGLWVESRDLDTIVVAGNGDAEFDYFVNGIRRGFRDIKIVDRNNSFVPEVRGVPYGSQFPDEFRQLLVDNGILNADFTPNEAVAERMGWALRDPSPEDLGNSSDPTYATGE